MQELARVLTGGIYCLSPQSQPNKYIGTFDNATSNSVQLYSGEYTNSNEEWNIIWLAEGQGRSYRGRVGRNAPPCF